MPAPDKCTIAGTAYDAHGVPDPDAFIDIKKVVLNGVAITTESEPVRADEDGVIEFDVPRGSVAYLYGNIIGLNTQTRGHAVEIPDAASATLESLLPSVIATINNVSQGQLTAIDERVTALEEGGGASYLVYVAKLSQMGGSDPTAIVLENTLGGSIVWARDGTGAYSGTLSGAFPAARSWFARPSIDLNAADGSEFHAHLNRGTDNIVSLNITDAAGLATDGFNNLSVEIRVYPA